MRQYLVAGNWKMHGSLADNRALIDGILEGAGEAPGVEFLVCPPSPYLAPVGQQLAGSGLEIGAQDVSEHESGAYTGEVSAAMLVDLGCRYAIVGHSERRTLYGETDDRVAAKFAAAHKHGLVPILCIGETLEHRESDETEAVIRRQLMAVIDEVGIAAFADAVVAYEPVWAIGTGRTASPEQAGEVHTFIRGLVRDRDAQVADGLRILYGGSMKGDNAPGLFAREDIDGGLIGGASLKAAEFLAIGRAAAAAG
ncbi:triose-phosphate isomerase [Lentisalinibacter sediminis]|uniref:triose-phosphate isomerase n=1 Tax=Lentisalinibacter sediminis TaxID=2992237 RepID=UPI00386902EA